ncbi:GNAT family N-acetyltransferase [Arenimonas fontis]|uniref:GNAT family N-acetyltransferase n=1 Tax=Arenimonas fontis TaxID=2608255 RepID=A0A5B2Z8W4_9GAMM|nr:GNAT family N-acetyltransferase [Arenimonas fontis]KAA2283963.1 GNAT family N-acetyltransferase [Arenimonas fontis]
MHPLDNPVWESLAGRHSPLALGRDGVLRYPAGIAPFLGVREPGLRVDDALHELVAPGEETLLLGPLPQAPAGWRLEPIIELVQMHCPAPLPAQPGPDIVELGDAHQGDIHALVALVYPHYFRSRTTALGRYFGIYLDGRLAAMAGERMGPAGFRELSAICTHPDFLGRGLARRLMAFLSNDLLEGGLTPFLHVSPENRRALELYERNGYRLRARIPFHRLCRPASEQAA